jgi:hypothetical protein
VRKGLVTAATAALLLVLAAPAAAQSGCDPLDPADCLLPWPNDHFRKGGRLALTDAMMPRNKDGRPIRARDYNRSDGFSPGQTIVTLVPRLDLRRSGAVPITNMARTFARRAPIVVIDAKTGRRQLIWAELDQRATSDRTRTLNIHPGANWREGRRYIVALRNLKDAGGRELRARRAFRVYRDRLRSRSRAVERRRPNMERIFRALRRAGIARRDLYLAWDFTVASRRSLSQRLLSIRDRAFAELGDRNLRDVRVAGSSPAFAVSRVDDSKPAVRRVDGTFTVPCFLDRPGCPPGSRYRLDRRGLPVRTPGNTQTANFICLVPKGQPAPGRALLFGHGLLGTAEAVLPLEPLVTAQNIVACATDWSGMSTSDVPNVLDLSGDLSRFPTLADRNQQGFLNFMFLGRLMIHPQGLPSHAAFAGAVDTSALFYAGASQGGILGGALTAVAPDFTRSALIVPAMNFSVLLTRSTQFERFQQVLFPSYPNEVERALVNSMIQVLWDRGEANGYAWHMTRDPYPNTPLHTVLLHEAFGDHQVANVATEVEARVIGARLREPALDPGRSLDKRPFYRIPRIASYPYRGNALVVYDIGPLRGNLGTPPPPIGNLPPEAGVDPHGLTAFSVPAALQFSEFLKTGGAFVNTCGDDPCYAAGWTGP